jgi:hypothetical protein
MSRRTIILAAALATVGAGATATGAFGGGKAAQTAIPRVPISAREFKFTGQRTFQAGTVTFAVTNKGTFPHNFFVVSGPKRFGVGSPTAPILPGQTGYATVDLVPGAYLAICGVRNGGHMAAGMVRSFTVGTQDRATGEWHA